MTQQTLGRIQWGGLTMGPGTPYMVTAVSGLDDMPDIRSEDVARPGQHGDYTGPDFTGPRTVTLSVGLRGDSPDDLRALSLALRDATQPQTSPAPLQFLDQDLMVQAKVRKRSIPYDVEYLWRLGTAALEFYCADPYLYSLTEYMLSTAAYSPAVGRSYPLVYGTSGPAARNIAFNPSAESLTNVEQWGSGVGRNVVTTDKWTGTSSIEHTLNPAAAYGSRWIIEPVSGGSTVQFSTWVKLDAAATWSAGLLSWRSGTNTTLLTTPISPLPTPGTWTKVTGSYTLAAGETCDNVGVSFTASTSGAKWLADGMMTESGATLHDYIDGDQPGCIWEGTRNNSPSRRLVGTGRTYGSAGTNGRITAVNGGASPAYPVLRIDGPVANPAIEQVTTGAILTLDCTLQAGDYLLIDTRSRAVLLQGSTPRRSWVRAGSTWPVLLPGSNELAYRANSLPGASGQASLLTVTWRDTTL